MNLNVRGLEQLSRGAARIERQLKAQLEKELIKEGKSLLDQANAVAPTETGEMVASSSVTSEVREGKVSVAAAYLDEKAAAVHEGFHGGKDSEGVLPGEKWFEKTLNGFAPGFEERVAAGLKREVGE